jgi:hypothetical protein
VAVALATAPAASAQHVGDIGLRIASGTIETTEITGGGYGAPRRVFAGTFGDTGVAWFTANPGYDAAPGTFAAGTRAGVRFADAVLAWDARSCRHRHPVRLQASGCGSRSSRQARPAPRARPQASTLPCRQTADGTATST